MMIEFGGVALAFLVTVFSLTTATTANAMLPTGIDSKEAYSMVMTSPSDTFIVDVRTVAEYTFVGHPDLPSGVPNIPLKFFPSWEPNSDFALKVAERYKKNNRLIMICRSGGRAEIAAEILIKAGFKRVFYMTDSFEGRADEKGHRTVDGWKVNNLPYTYEIKEELRYK